MPILSTHDGRRWELPHFHSWSEREDRLRCDRRPIIAKDTRIGTIGSCFAEELAKAMASFGLNGAMHPAGLFYSTRSIRQEIERTFGLNDAYADEPLWRLKSGLAHPMKSYYTTFETEQELRAWSDDLDAGADELIRTSDVLVMTLGLVECWRNPSTGNTFRVLPHPDVFEQLQPEFHRLTVEEMLDDLTAIRAILAEHTKAKLVVTVSPIPLHTTFTGMDVRIANTESKSRVRAAVSQFIDENPDVAYFHSYELVTSSDDADDFLKPDRRHVHPQAAKYIVAEFLRQFADETVDVPRITRSSLSRAARVARWRRRLGKLIRGR